MKNDIKELKIRHDELLNRIEKAPFWVYGSVIETTLNPLDNF